jgi:hypothetical protein
MIFPFFLIREQTLHFTRIIMSFLDTTPFAHGTLAAHLVWNFLALSYDFFCGLLSLHFCLLLGGSSTTLDFDPDK